MILAGKQFWLGPARGGQVVRFWADPDLIHLFVGGTRVKTVRSHLTTADLTRLVVQGAVTGGSSPLPPVQPGDAVEVERVVSKDGNISLAGQVVLAAEILGGRRVGIRIARPAAVLRPGQPRAAADPTQPAHPRPGSPAPRKPTRRPTTEAIPGAGPGAATGLEHRSDHGLWPEGRIGTSPSAPDADRARLRDHPRGRARRRRNPGRAPHHHPARP
jgi:hypothetical protein